MKFEHNSKYETIAVYAAIASCFTVVCVVVGLNLPSIAAFLKGLVKISKPLIYAVAFAFMMLPIQRLCYRKVFAFTENKKSRPRLRFALSIALTYLIVLTFLTMFVLIFIPQVVAGYNDLQSKLGGYIEMAQGFVDNAVASSSIFAEQYSHIAGSLNEFISNIYQWLVEISPRILAAASDIVTETKNILLGFLFSVYFLISKTTLAAQLKKVARALLPDAAYDRTMKVSRLCGDTFSRFVVGKAIDSVLMGLSCVTLMTILKLPYAPLLSLVLGISSFIPYIGILIGALPGLFVIFVSEPHKTLWFLFIVILLQQADSNYIEPRVLNGRQGLSSMWVLAAIVFMGGMFGAAGLIAGVPLFNVLYILFKEYVEKRLSQRGLPAETAHYYNISPGDNQGGGK